MKCTVIGIAGGTGSGKSTFTARIRAAFPDKVAVLYHDNYYKARDNIPFEERKTINYDHPNSLETDLLIEHVKLLKNGKSVDAPTYDFTRHTRAKTTFVEWRYGYEKEKLESALSFLKNLAELLKERAE
ncbi:MAG: hypothetical protein SOX25_09775 [Eubacteriales bacterium]|nr:hypothetical protein [Eubacteriales bacterium]